MESTLASKIKYELAARGIEISEVETIKNGIICKGIRVDTGTKIKPVVYYSPDESIEAFVDKVIEVAAQPTPEVDINGLITRDNILKNCYLCIQKQGAEDIVKREYLNLELYVRLRIDFGKDETAGSTKITSQILEKAGLTEEEIFDAARANSLTTTSIMSMAEALGMMGMPTEMLDDVPMYVGRSSETHGAALLALPEAIHEFCNEKGYDQLILLPSSTEEILLVTAESGEPEVFVDMVANVNASEVDEVLRLEDCCYRFDNRTQTVSIAATKEVL